MDFQVIPILQTLYNAPDSTSHHIYMTLIVLLILSEDDGFNKGVHQIVNALFSINLTTYVSIKNDNFFLFLLPLGSEEHSLVHGTFNFRNFLGWPSNFSRNTYYSVQYAKNA